MGDYTIQKGDTLAKIAKEYGTTVKALAAQNDIKNINCIHAGSKLEITSVDTTAINMSQKNVNSKTHKSDETGIGIEKNAFKSNTKTTNNKTKRIKELKEMEKDVIRQENEAYNRGDYKLASIYSKQQDDIRKELIALGDKESCAIDKLATASINGFNEDLAKGKIHINTSNSHAKSHTNTESATTKNTPNVSKNNTARKILGATVFNPIGLKAALGIPIISKIAGFFE